MNAIKFFVNNNNNKKKQNKNINSYFICIFI